MKLVGPACGFWEAAPDLCTPAEVLGLQQEDYVILTRHSFYSKNCVPDNSKTYETWIGYQEVEDYWGFDSTQDSDGKGPNVSESMAGADGLTLIKEKLLPRSGLSFSDLLILLQTKYLNGSLVIESNQPQFRGAQFTGKLEDMRLRRLSPDGNTENLDVDSCDRLQRFVRLQHKVGWPIEELDAVLSTLIQGSFKNITPQVLDDLAAITQLAEISGYSPTELQPLWGNINTHSENSLGARLFSRSSLDTQETEPLLILVYGAMAAPYPRDWSISGHASVISSALDVKDADLLQMLKPAGEVPDELSLEHISILYRQSLLCKIIGVSPIYLSAVLSLFPYPLDPFASPRNTLRLIRATRAPRWDPNPLTLEQLLAMMKGMGPTEGDMVQRDVQITHSISSTLKKAKLLENDANGIGSPAPGVELERRIQSIIAGLKSHIPEASVQVLRFVLEDCWPPSEVGKWIDSTRLDLSIKPFDGYFLAPQTGEYNIELTSAGRETLHLDREKLEFNPDSLTIITQNLMQGRWYKFTYTGILQGLKWKVKDAPETQQLVGFDPDQLVSHHAVTFTRQVTPCLTQISALSKRLSLSVDELRFWKSNSVFDFFNLSLPAIRQLEEYYFLREMFIRNGGQVSLLELYKWLYVLPNTQKGNLAANEQTDKLYNMLSNVTGWSVSMCTSFIAAKYPQMRRTDPSCINLFRDISVLFVMCEAVTFVQNLNFPGSMIGAFVSMAVPSPPWATDAVEFRDAARLRSAIESRYSTNVSDSTPTPFSTASDEIRNCQREALIHTLLQQKYAKSQNLTDADKLFGHFLIDVQMGPVLHTSRLTQAIATLQLFVQQCMLGKESGIDEATLKKLHKNAESVFHYRLWEANRKAFLYPENWIDPTLRDNKSEQFQTLESALMKTKLDSQSISALVRDYVHSTSDIANLQIESYIWQCSKEGKSDNLHFFGRTGHAPFVFYYRKLTIHHPAGLASYPHWWPWTRMDVDIPVLATDMVGKRLAEPGSHIAPAIHNDRLYVFLPEFAVAQEANPANPVPNGDTKITDMKVKEMSSGQHKRHWEIRMGFTQLRDGKWAPKVVSPSKVEVKNVDQDTDSVKDTSGFRFTTGENNNELSIRIEHGQRDMDLGGFVMKNHQLVLGTTEEWSNFQKSTTSFGKIKSGDTVAVGCFDISTKALASKTSVTKDANGKQQIDYPDKQLCDSQLLNNRASPTLTNAIATKPGLKPIYECMRSKFCNPSELKEDLFGWLVSYGIFSETTTPPAVYMWELAVHIPSLLLERLMATQQLDLALMIAKLVFDPTRPDGDLAMDEWLEGKCNVHAAARGQPVAYMKRVAMKYVEIVLALGDKYFRENTLESIPFAIQRYTEASHVYGPPPVEIPRLGKLAVKSYREIEAVEKRVYMELDIPFYSDIHTVKQPIEALGFIFTGYFCLAANPSMASLRTLIDDRLHKIRNGMDINGSKQRLPLFEPPIDPGAVVRANAGVGGMSVAGLLAGLQSPMPNYRFRYLLQRAFELVQELKMLGQQFLSIRERKDAEALSLLRYQHQQSLLVLAKSIKERQKKEVDGSIATLQATRGQQEMRLQFYLSLTGDKKNVPQPGDQWQDLVQSIDQPTPDQLRGSTYEKTEIDKANTAKEKVDFARAAEATAAALFGIPNMSTEVEPWGIGMSISYGGSEVGQATSTLSSVKQIDAQLASDDGQQAGRTASLVRQVQERRMEINMTGHELMKIDREMDELKGRKATWDAEIQAQEETIQCAVAEEAWLRNRFTNQQLYTMLDNQMGNLYHATYMLASEMAKAAKGALDFEYSLKYLNSTTRQTELAPGLTGYWDDSLHGQLAGEALYLDLRRMEMMHLENKPYDFEITRTVSLRQVDPGNLLKLRRTGSATLDLPEVLFDMDYPGHYCRRIASVAVTIPCILGAYSSLNCTLTLTKHKYRISPIAEKKNYETPSQESFRSDNIPITAIAVSNGVQDNGGYGLHFLDSEKYGPFEGAGAISTWQIELPEKFGQFDYNTISDVVLRLQYTALYDGGLKKTATDCATDLIGPQSKNKGSLPLLAVDLKNDYPDQWRRIKDGMTGMTLSGLCERLPYWAQSGTVTTDTISLFLSKAPSKHPTITTTGAGVKELRTANNQNGYYERSTSSTIQIQKSQEWTLTMGDTDFDFAWLVIKYSVELK
ncbi:hypothetical protein BDW59DRAFT_163101 [Aspergillus cavernicola]|uniref:Tc toxin complex TcA C-terminal TcB-binding domain-containing protein n=1 Tax=Aspergillus cavernicola TaxID=176166 RepID=A0ABR4I7L0_9EURO